MSEPPCPDCEGSGYIIEDHCGSLVAVECACQKTGRVLRFIKEAAVPARYATVDLSQMRANHRAQESALEIACNWVRMAGTVVPDSGLVFCGPPGSGKTHILCAMVLALAQRLISVRFSTVRDLLEAERRSFHADDNLPSPMHSLERMPVLALDDFGVERRTDWAAECLDGLVNTRWAEALPLLVTTNIPAPEWRNAFGPRIESRLRGACTCVEIAAPDARTRRKEKNSG